MKTSLDQLPQPPPASKQKELARVQDIIVNRFQAEEHIFKLEKIILFGSYARGTWVEDGYVKDGITYEYKSDFDILVVTHYLVIGNLRLDKWRSIFVHVVLTKNEL